MNTKLIKIAVHLGLPVLLSIPFLTLMWTGAQVANGEWDLPDGATLQFVYGSVVILTGLTLLLWLRVMIGLSYHSSEVRRLEDRVKVLEGGSQ